MAYEVDSALRQALVHDTARALEYAHSNDDLGRRMALEALAYHGVDADYPVINQHLWGRRHEDGNVTFSEHWRNVRFVVVKWVADHDVSDELRQERFWVYFNAFAHAGHVPEVFAVVCPDEAIRAALVEKYNWNAFKPQVDTYLPEQFYREDVYISRMVLTFHRRACNSVRIPAAPGIPVQQPARQNVAQVQARVVQARRPRQPRPQLAVAPRVRRNQWHQQVREFMGAVVRIAAWLGDPPGRR